MKLALERQIQLAFFVALLLLLTIGFFAYRSANALNEALGWERHTQEVLFQLNETLRLTTDLESNGRGYVVTGNENFLEPYRTVRQNTNSSLDQLDKLVTDNPRQADELENLKNSINEKIDFTNQLVEARQKGGYEAASRLISSMRGKQIMDKIRLSSGRMESDEKALLKSREEDLHKSVGDTLFILFFGTGAGILSLALANFAIYRETGKRRTAEEKLRDTNKDLESRVEQRTREISQKNDELEEQIRRREQAEQRRRIALEAGSLGTWIIDPKTNKSELDERSLALFGLSAEEFNGSGEMAFNRIHPEDFPTIEKLFQKSIVERAKFKAEFRVLMPDKSVRWNDCTGQPQMDENGEVTQIVGYCRDITEIKENELSLRRSELFARAILDSLSAHIAVLDRNGNVVAVNEAWQNFASENCFEEQVTGTGVGQNYLTICERAGTFEEETKKIAENLRALLKGEKPGFSFEYPCHAPGKERWYLLQASAMQDAEGGAVIAHINITDRKKAEVNLKNSEEFNRGIFENSPDCVNILDLDGALHLMNANGLRLMEIDDFDSLVGKSWVDFWQDDENEMAYQALEMARKGKTAHFDGFCPTAKGTPKWWDVSVAPVFDSENKTTRLIATSRDITERRQAEREREELFKREKAARGDAEIANRMRDEFLATVSHELRAPLNSILGWARMLEKGRLDEKTSAKAITTIVRNAEAQNRLIEDLLDVSRIISGKLRLEVMTIKPINVVEQALETVRPAAEAKGIKLEIKEKPDVSHISGDPNRLQQVIWNLLSNAIKFTPNEGKVALEIDRNEDFVEIRVKDTGVGIKEEFLPHVFDRFTQADASSIRKFGGLGLGLAIVRHITEMHGGTVHAFSAGENKGSTFVVRLPIIASPKEDETTAENKDRALAVEPSINLDGLLILVVDDEEDTRQLLVQSLTLYGATVICASSAAEALSEIKEKKPDVLVSDIGMPDEDGYSLIRKVRALDDAKLSRLPAVALTAFTRAQDRMRALSSGYQSHVAKPVEPDELATVIASLTGRLQMNEAEDF